MPGYRTRKEAKTYRKYRQQVESDKNCQFCVIKPGMPQYVEGGKHFIVTKNIFPYSTWDGQGVMDHLMIVPREHTDTLEGLSEAAAAEYVKLVGKYEARGYSAYSRNPGHIVKTVIHHHTHLIKSDNKRHRLHLYVRKPHLQVVI